MHVLFWNKKNIDERESVRLGEVQQKKYLTQEESTRNNMTEAMGKTTGQKRPRKNREAMQKGFDEKQRDRSD